MRCSLVQMIKHVPYTHKVDVYSFGIILWELMTAEVPFESMIGVQAAFAVACKVSMVAVCVSGQVPRGSSTRCHLRPALSRRLL